eukprot:CAMPEP_0117585560 /NCGR_PEP_ID=MMETSP0784-20121206/68216_1 /TAXON_ID=39447 /ORGANISM="" /LENGTH=559 /DNA_ID=CAMNT_0005386527 /DNA_START=28 /DNA_END=1707 /DNA_ORIENTATION=-
MADAIIKEFRKVHAEGDDLVTVEDCGTVMKSLGMEWGKEQEEELSKIVKVTDGKVDFVEFIKASFQKAPAEAPKDALIVSDHVEGDQGKKRFARKHLALKAALGEGHISETRPLALFIDEDDVREQVADLHAAFPPSEGFFHCFAVKANPTLEYMKLLKSCGMGFEAASIGELTNALRAFGVPSEAFPASFGFPNGGTAEFPKWSTVAGKGAGLVIDSPVKTGAEVHFCLEQGVPINADNWDELARIDAWVAKNGAPDISGDPIYGRIGLRINPQVGGGKNAQLSTGTATSKFGIGLGDDREKVVKAYLDRPWLNMVHGHVGSQGIPLDLMMAGIRALVELIRECNAKGCKIDVLDMGGGLTVNFGTEDVLPGYAALAAKIKEDVPGIFGEDKVVPTIMTEMGRTLSSKSGWLGSRIEYAKYSGGLKIVAQHAGVDICVRTVYHPDHWPLRMTVYKPDGTFSPFDPASDSVEPTNVSGPCCIAGDVIAWKRPLPKSLAAGDILMIHDVGGYYHSSYSKYNSRQAPFIYGYTTSGDDVVKFRVMQKGETVADTLRSFDPA